MRAVLSRGNAAYSIKKASPRRGSDYPNPATACNGRTAPRHGHFPTSPPKPCAEGLIPSAPAMKSPRSPEFRGFFCTFSAGLCFADRGRCPKDAMNVVSGGIRFSWFRLVQHHFSIKEILPRLAVCRLGEIIFSECYSSNPAVIPANRPVSFFT